MTKKQGIWFNTEENYLYIQVPRITFSVGRKRRDNTGTRPVLLYRIYNRKFSVTGRTEDTLTTTK